MFTCDRCCQEKNGFGKKMALVIQGGIEIYTRKVCKECRLKMIEDFTSYPYIAYKSKENRHLKPKDEWSL